MNASLGLLQVNHQATAATAGKTANNQSKSRQNSFSDKLHTAVSQSDTQETRDNKSEKLLLSNLPTSLMVKTTECAESQASTEDPLLGEGVVLNDNTVAEASEMLLAAPSAVVLPAAAADNTAAATVLITNKQQPLMPLSGLLTPEVVQSGKVTVVEDITVAAGNIVEDNTVVAGNIVEGDTVAAGNIVQDNTVAADRNPKAPAQMSKELNLISANTQTNGLSISTTRSTTQEQAMSLPAQSADTVEPLTIQNQNITIVPQSISTQSRLPKAESGKATEHMGESELSQTEIEVSSLLAPDQREKHPSKGFAGEGQKQSSAESLLNQSKIVQDLNISTVEVNNTQTFSQGLEAVLTKTNTITATEAKQPGAPLADVHQVADQIIEHTRLIAKPQNTEMIIKLKPEHLGELTLKVAVENGVVSASFHSNNSEVRHIIEQSLPLLKQDLANNGLKVDNVSISSGLDQFLPNHDQDRSSRQQFIKFTNRKAANGFIEAIDGELTEGRFTGTDSLAGVDYRI